jgi:RNA polymerase sigma-70 factor (ECF subfamily)
LEHTAAGDHEAFRALVERHQDRLVGLCERLLHDRAEALDAAQEVFLKAYRQAGKLKPKGELYTWLYRVATNHCLNRLRRRRLVRFVSLAPRDDKESAAIDPADTAPDSLQALDAKRRWQATRRSIAALPESQRTVLILARFEGLSYRQIAKTLQITEGAVESRLFRAMRNLERAQESPSSRVSQKGTG